MISLLSKGLKFTPTPHTNNTELGADIREFARNLQWKLYFDDNNSGGGDSTNSPLRKNKSKKEPPNIKNDAMNICVKNLKKVAREVITSEERRKRSNLKFNEFRALKELSGNENLVIKSADKGGAVIVMNTEFYRSKMLMMLQDTTTYKKTHEARDKETMTKIMLLCNKYRDILLKPEIDFLHRFEYRTSNLYGLPKVHKSDLIKKAIEEQSTGNNDCIRIENPDDLKFRPIVGGPNCPTNRLSELIDMLLKPFCQHVPSYLKDNIDFLRFLPRDLMSKEDGLMVTMDITSLYTNIDHKFGLEAVAFWIDSYPETLHKRFNKQFVLEALELILTNNVFYFDGEYYIQENGTAMGTKAAPNYATLSVGYFEHKTFIVITVRLSPDLANYLKSQWRRFLDDVWVYWLKRFGEVTIFLEIINRINPKIKFTLESSETEMPFLNILTKKTNNIVTTDIFYKKTDSKNYVPFVSCHPSHTKVNIPFTLARMICTIVDDDETKSMRLSELKCNLKRKGYPPNVINTGIAKARAIDITELRSPKNVVENANPITFVQTHNPNNRQVTSLIHDSIGLLKMDDQYREKLENSKLIKCKRQPPNLSRILCKSRFDSQKIDFKVKKCGDTRCRCCDNITPGSEFKIVNSTIKPNALFTCSSQNLIYIIKCQGCGELYVGETGTTLRSRVRVHRQEIMDPTYRKTPVDKHIASCSRGYPHFQIFPFFKGPPGWSPTQRRAKEDYFIHKLSPKLNKLRP